MSTFNAETADNLEDIEKQFAVVAVEYQDIEKLKKFNENDLKTKQAKEDWRKFCALFEKKIEDYNFGTLLRTDSSAEYGQYSTCFVVRIQFYAFEVARNRHGLNDWAVGK